MIRITVVVISTPTGDEPGHLAGLDALPGVASFHMGVGALSEPGGPMIGQRGLSLLELLVAAMLTTVVAGALLSAYIATTRSFGESSAQAALQRQGTLVLEEIGRQVRGAMEPKPGEKPPTRPALSRRHLQRQPRLAVGENGGRRDVFLRAR